ncbi:MAG: aminopeptidase P N-terminal domain-containing protein [Flavobacteriaceae bacterium]|nr:aminopeptidase P N-terminal domain-containing protein [Flavobacteriaceae bacterium]
MFKQILTYTLIIVCLQFSYSQDNTPQDFLSKEFHKNRRDALRKALPENSVAVFFANPVRNRANDVEYIYHQDPNFYYLTGYKEPHAVLLIFSENKDDDNEIIYIQKKNPQAEQWTGRRLGIEGVKEKLGFNTVYNGEDFKDLSIDFKKFEKVLIIDFKDDYRNSKRNNADIYDLTKQFKEKISFDRSLLPNPTKDRFYQLIKSTEIDNSANVVERMESYLQYYPELKKDELLKGYQNAATDELRKEFKQKISLQLEAKPKTNVDIYSLNGLMGGLREIKLPEEMKLLKKAIDISAIGQIEIMKAMHVNMSETEVQGIHEFVYKKYGAEYEGYPSIVGAGNNGCVLHYIKNNKTKLGNELVLMDLGAEYHGYTADVTRTIPANGKFSPEQKAIYDLVYEAQEAGIAEAKVGNSFNAPNAATREVINRGLVTLNILDSIQQQHNYYPHGSSHYLGLDVHDAGSYGPFQANTVITVEPGIYIPEGSPCDKKWWGIAVRIEDDILITDAGPINLSARAPRKSEDIEKMMQLPSVLDSFQLPKLD